MLPKNKIEDFLLEIPEEKQFLHGQQVRVIESPGFSYSKKKFELATVNFKVIKEMFLSSVIVNFNFELQKVRATFFITIRGLQREFQPLKIQTLIETSKIVMGHSVTNFDQGAHVERLGPVLYVHKLSIN